MPRLLYLGDFPVGDDNKLTDRTRALGFVALVRGAETDDLQRRDPRGFLLLSLIARRAARTENRYDGLEEGQALLGDHQAAGLTRQEYRSAKSRLTKYKLATFQTTNKGTIATLLDSMVYDINCDLSNHQKQMTATKEQPSSNHQATTNKKVKKDKNEKKGSALVVFRGLLEKDRYEPLRGENWAHLYETWDAYRTRFKMPLTEGAVKRDLDNMLRVLGWGGSFELIYQWVQEAEYSGGKWRGWYFDDKVEKWKIKRAESAVQGDRAQLLAARGNRDD